MSMLSRFAINVQDLSVLIVVQKMGMFDKFNISYAAMQTISLLVRRVSCMEQVRQTKGLKVGGEFYASKTHSFG